MLQQKHKQGSSKKEPSNGQVSLGVLIQNIQELAKPLSITSKEILLAYNHNYNAQARTFEDTTIGGLEGILTSLQLIHEAKNIRPEMRNSLTGGYQLLFLVMLHPLENGYFMIIQKPFINSYNS